MEDVSNGYYAHHSEDVDTWGWHDDGPCNVVV